MTEKEFKKITELLDDKITLYQAIGEPFGKDLDTAIKLSVAYEKLQQENKKLNGAIQTYDILLKANVEENKRLKNLIDTILNFSFFKEECPLNFGFENNTNEDKSQSVFYEDEWCEDNCNGNYKDCWLKYFKRLKELEEGDSNE